MEIETVNVVDEVSECGDKIDSKASYEICKNKVVYIVHTFVKQHRHLRRTVKYYREL